MKILIYVNAFIPGFKSGGPIRSIAAIANALKDRASLHVVTKDRDAGDVRSYANVKINCWNDVNSFKVKYIGRGVKGFIAHLTPLFMKNDLIYFNSFFNFKYTLLPLLIALVKPGTKILVAPRGELSQGALSIKSKRKIIYIFLFKMFKIHRKVCFHATSQEELEELRRCFGETSKLFFVPNLTSVTQIDRRIDIESSNLVTRIVFLSRISEKKNLHTALMALKSVEGEFVFDIFGEANRSEDRVYLERCKNISTDLPSNVRVNFKGPLDHTAVVATLQEYDLFFLPTLGENFGHAIVEALASGIPVLISDKTPWGIVTQHAAGWCLSPWDVEGFTRVLNKFHSLGSTAKRQYGHSAHDFYLRYVSEKNSERANKTLQMFLEASGLSHCQSAVR